MIIAMNMCSSIAIIITIHVAIATDFRGVAIVRVVHVQPLEGTSSNWGLDSCL